MGSWSLGGRDAAHSAMEIGWISAPGKAIIHVRPQRLIAATDLQRLRIAQQILKRFGPE
jgi:hypothetical protein